jgi:phage gpG-like protein
MEIQGAAPIRRRLEGMLRRCDDWTPALERIADRIRTHWKAVFASGGAATRTGSWQPLSVRYAAWKAEHYPGAGLLIKDGGLEASMTTKDAPGHVEEVGPHHLVIGSDLTTPNGRWSLGLIHQMGRKDGSIPPRAIIDPPDVEIAGWLHELRAEMMAGNP